MCQQPLLGVCCRLIILQYQSVVDFTELSNSGNVPITPLGVLFDTLYEYPRSLPGRSQSHRTQSHHLVQRISQLALDGNSHVCVSASTLLILVWTLELYFFP